LLDLGRALPPAFKIQKKPCCFDLALAAAVCFVATAGGFHVSHFQTIFRWGWNSYFQASWNEDARDGAVPARVIAQQRGFWRVAGEFGECWGEAAGRLRLAGDGGADWPAVGDWVAVELRDGETAALIQEVLPRRSRFVRKSPGKKAEEQVIAANVDTALLVSALDGDFNPRRVERYLAQCWESGAKPVLVLNKADACADAATRAAEMERVALGAALYLVSAKTGQGIEELEKMLAPGQTFVLLGSSGVGKSTLANRLLGESRQDVQPVREGDSRGRHTTTARELFVLPGGALLMDTPGLRELQLWDAEEGLAEVFADIDALAARCRFGDCKHEGEPGCAVRAALEAGTLDEARLESRRKLLREQEFLRRKVDPEARHEHIERWKQLHRAQRQKYQQRAKDGGKR
jgi:ribosome biogenesis GTPase / thiamine phosphate phosphatase